MKQLILTSIFCLFILTCKNSTSQDLQKDDSLGNISTDSPFIWEGANIYFLLTDRFNNGDETNDVNFDRTKEPGKLRGFEGGDIKGVTQKVKEGYFTDLGINAIWMTPIVEQIHGATDEGTGVSYGFHGYWTKDWTAIDPNYGTKEDLHELVKEAHSKGIRIVLDAVINHTGPVTEKDPVWPKGWVRTDKQCLYDNYENTVTCTLVANLPDIRTESNEEVDLPPQLVEKWKSEGRYEQEVAELDDFFKRTGHPRAPRFYIMKWLTDYITEFGIDGYRCDTVKHTEPYVWEEFKKECDYAFSEFKKNNPDKVMDDNDFYLVGEVYNYGISAGKAFDFSDKKVNYFDDMFTAQINFEFKWNAKQMEIQNMFAMYDDKLQTDLKGFSILNYMSSHDDGSPFDALRKKPYETATKLLLSPGASQVYYGDELARILEVEGAQGDANLRSVIDWEKASNDEKTNDILEHWQKIGKFRANHPSIGAGKHQMITSQPYYFFRSFQRGNYKDIVVVGIDVHTGAKSIDVSKLFKNGDTIRDAYADITTEVKDGRVIIDSPYQIVLLEKL
ncbi:alpha-amylase family glycosyl hydrolase [Winogradskyella alexanderae]|uniref:Alpha-amylase n=1 Tax=Winogradskyella alexanderae TaxID=2877123 RepID=A0ABS7XRC2_9FLAO|nr:alpha-amylase family glycosyl hydrolase [Winogradskyella alexanderae]MCA0132567.1 alpha-amylase [Winogradskyella alexanderae]